MKNGAVGYMESNAWHGEGKAIVLLSGGLDSTLCVALAVKEHGKENVKALNIKYGQKHAVEEAHADDVCNWFDITGEVIRLPAHLFKGESTLIQGGADNPEVTYEELAASRGVSPTYVPFRNGSFLSLASAYALTHRASWLYYGAHAEDSRNWAYPDCTPEFNGSMASAIYIGTYGKVRLVTPLQQMSKVQIIEESVKYSSPVHLTYSCYNGRTQHCGKCPTCVARIEAFKSVGFIDPVKYEIDIDWSGCGVIPNI